MINFSELLWKPGRVSSKTSSPYLGISETAERDDEFAQIPVEKIEVRKDSRIALLTDPNSPGADRFRYLRMRLREFKELASLKSIVITSPLPKDGKSTIALNLAAAMTEGGKRSVLLVEADMYHPTLAETLGLRSRPGLAECLQNGLDPIPLLTRVEPLGCYLMQAGKPQGNPTELLHLDSLSRMMPRLSEYFDWILVDTPPVVPLTDAISLSRHVDASLLVVRADSTKREAIDHALALLGAKHVLGIVFNDAEGLNRLYPKYNYYQKKG